MWRNGTVLGSALRNYRATLYSFMITNIKKSEIETQTIDTGDVKTIEKRRLVTVTMDNIADISQNVSSIKVIKTPEQDPNNELAIWTFPDTPEPIIIEPHSAWSMDVIDYNSTEGEVYWLSTEVVTTTVPVLVTSQFIKRFTEEDLYSVANDSLDEAEYLEGVASYLEHLMYLKKSISSAKLMPGDLVEISVKINNFAPIHRPFNLTERLPFGFEIEESGGANLTEGGTLVWEGRLNPDSSRLIRYTSRYTDNDTLGLDHFEPSVLSYENQTLFSERIPFIRQFIPAKKIFIQKKLRYALNDEILVHIQMQNLGESDIHDLLVREFLAADDVFREISVMPEQKGTWRVPLLKKGETWEVTYVTDDNMAVNLLPEVYGIDKQIVLKTLVFENVVRNQWILPAMSIIEIAAPAFILGFIVFYFGYRRRVFTRQTWGIRQLGREIRRLRKETELKPGQKIEHLKRESGVRSEIPGTQPLNVPHRPTPREQAQENIDKLKQIEKDSLPRKGQ